MATRKYTASKRLAQLGERQQRVIAATAALHAEKGPVTTRYADIAERAGVSLPTVYSYFPDQAGLMAACTSHVARAAPALPSEAILAADDLRAAATLLVDATDKLNLYFEPWATWRAEGTIAFVAEFRAAGRERLKHLLAQLLAQHHQRPAAAKAAAWESLLSFDLWQRLVRQHALSRAHVRALLVELLLAALGPQPATSTPVPRRRP